MTLFGGDEHPGFVRSRDKFEAVNRLAALTGSGPEDLGPGSKERKRVLENVVRFLALPIDVSLSKTRLASEIVTELGGSWEARHSSSGETITLAGLDLILELATARAGRRERTTPETVGDEAGQIVAEAAAALPVRLEMRECVEEMRRAENANWAQTEWVGFYFEAVARARCQSVLGGEPGHVYGRTRFDYRWHSTWDFKAHTETDRRGRSGRDLVLNDMEAVRACVGEGGLGFVVLHGAAEFDESGELRTWHAAERAATGRRSRQTTTGRASRVYKTRFMPNVIEAVMLRDLGTIERGLAGGWLTVMNQGRQISGHPRKPKFMLRRRFVPDECVVAQVRLTHGAG